MEDLQPRWLRYDLRGDPFFSNALDPATGTPYPIALFQGRARERRRLVQLVLDGDHSAVLIHAAGGHGKTTLANAACYDLQRRGYVVLPEEIQFNPDGGLEGFLARVLHLMLQALHDHGLKLPRVPDDGDLRGVVQPALAQARLLVELTRMKTGASLDVNTIVGGGGSSIQYGFLQPRLDPGTGRSLLERMVQEATGLDPAIAGFVLRVNDLDVSAAAHPDELSTFFQDVRNILQVPGLHFIMMGSHAVRDMIERLARVRTEFAASIHLESFHLDDVHAILAARYKHLKGKPPAAEDLVAALHEVHRGDLRNILRDLRRAVQLVDPVEARPVTATEAMPLLEEAHYRELERLSQEGWQTLDAMAQAGQPLRKTDLAKILGLTEPATGARMKTLEELGLIELVRREGRSAYLLPKSRAVLAIQAYRRRTGQ